MPRKSTTRHPKSDIGTPQSDIHNPQSAIHNPKSTLQNPQSEIRTPQSYFLPYQWAWLEDNAMLKIWEKSRRCGMTYTQSYEDVRDAAAGKWDVWFSSADESAAREYILYCQKWAELFHETAKAFGETALDDKGKSIQIFSITFKSGKRINALTSSPTKFRSKGGKVVLDEFAFHADAEEMWRAAEPVTTWGFPLRILSTHNGKGSKFYKLLEAVRQGKINGSVHRTNIEDAIQQGLLDKIFGRKTTKAEQQAWIEDKKRRIGIAAFNQEYMAIPIDEVGAFLPYQLIESCQQPNTLLAPISNHIPAPTLMKVQNWFYVGMDIARHKNLSVIWVAEKIERRLYTRFVVAMKDTKFAHQYLELKKILAHPKCYRACLDQTGIGEQLTETAQEDFGKFKVEGIRFSLEAKNKMAHQLYRMIEDKEFIIPDSDIIKEDFHSIEKEQTLSNNVRLKTTKNEMHEDSHADFFWAAALCTHAAYQQDIGEFFIASDLKPSSQKLLNTYIAL